MKLNKVCAALAACGLAFGMSSASAQTLSGDKIVIGFVTDMSSLYSDIDGPGGVEAIRMAIADMQKEFPGKKIERRFRRSSEQGRHRVGQGSRVDRSGRRRRDHRRHQFIDRAGECEDCGREEEALYLRSAQQARA